MESPRADKAPDWTIRPLASAERAAVGSILAAAFAGQYGPALGDDPALAAGIAAVLPDGVACYVGERAGRLYGVGMLRFYGNPDFGLAETGAIWTLLRARQSLPRALRSLLLLSLLGADPHLDRQTGYVSSLAVVPAAQGQGLGAALLAHLEALSRAAGKSRLALHVTDTNAGARRLYEQHGFTVARREPALFTRRLWGYRALLYMVKRLG